MRTLASLESLVLDSNELGMGGAEGLSGALGELPRLRSLSLCGCAYKNSLPGLPPELWRLGALETLNGPLELRQSAWNCQLS